MWQRMYVVGNWADCYPENIEHVGNVAAIATQNACKMECSNGDKSCLWQNATKIKLWYGHTIAAIYMKRS